MSTFVLPPQASLAWRLKAHAAHVGEDKLSSHLLKLSQSLEGWSAQRMDWLEETGMARTPPETETAKKTDGDRI
jgi:hypothetical protein